MFPQRLCLLGEYGFCLYITLSKQKSLLCHFRLKLIKKGRLENSRLGSETALSKQPPKTCKVTGMDTNKLWELATPILEKNDFGVSHTRHVFDIAKEHFPVAPPLEELTYASIILHDIGGCTIKDQYEKGPAIATQLLKELGCKDSFIRQVCLIIATHHKPRNSKRTNRPKHHLRAQPFL